MEPEAKIKIEKIKDKKEGDKVVFDKVLLVEEKGKVQIGEPFLTNTEVQGKVVEQGRNRKVTILKFKSKSHQKTKRGHRQPYTQVKIEKIKS